MTPNQITTTEKMKVVAVFDGWIETPSDHFSGKDGNLFYHPDHDRKRFRRSFTYHTDWNELHRVWENIRDINRNIFNVKEWRKYAEHTSNIATEITNGTPASTFDAIYEGIVFVNSLNPKQP